MNCKTFLALAVAAVALSTTPARADLAKSGDKLLQQELRQERVGVQLGAVIEEYERNGLEGDDVVVLRAIRSVLDKLTEKEIARVVSLLQQTRTGIDADATRRNALDAFAGQKGVTVQLRALLLEYQRQQILQEIASRFAQLARRQGENLKEVVGLAQVTREAYPDATAEEGDWSCVDLAPEKAFVKPVPLEVIKSDALLAGIPLVRQSRLSVSPLTKVQFARVLALGGTKL